MPQNTLFERPRKTAPLKSSAILKGNQIDAHDSYQYRNNGGSRNGRSRGNC